MDDYQTAQVAQEEETAVLPFCRDALRTASGLYIVWLIIALFIAISVYILPPSRSAGTAIPLALAVYYLVCAVHVLFRLRMDVKQNVLAPDIIYILMYTMFHLGYVTLYSLGILPYATEVFFYESSIPKAMLVINIGLIGFLFGYEVLGLRNLSLLQENRIIIPSAGWCTFGLFMMIIAVGMHFGTLMVIGPGVFIKYGYTAVANITKYTTYGWALLWQVSYLLMALGITIYIVSSGIRYGKLFASKLALVLFLFFLVTVILEGERGSMMLFALPLLFVRHYLISPIRIRHLVILFVAVLFLFTAMAVVRTIAYKPRAMLQEYQYQRSTGRVAWYSPFVEMGGSFLVVDITTEAVPRQEPYWKGASWRDAAFHMIPFFQGFAARRGWSRVSPAEWITVTYFGTESAGKAFTVAAEGYLNFGFIGTFVQLLFFGLFFRWLSIKFSLKPSAMWGIMMLGCIGRSLMVVRNPLSTATNVFALIFVIAFLLNLFLGNEAVDERSDFGEIESSI